MQHELQTLKTWVDNQLETDNAVLKPLTGDASFRSYFRVEQAERSYIVMLAPPTKEKTAEFVRIARAWHAQGIRVPEVLAWEQQQGFVLLSDFGNELLLDQLNASTVDDYYHQAMQSLLAIQKLRHPLPAFDEAHTRLELSYFQDWFLEKLLEIELTTIQKDCLNQINARLVCQTLEQPQVTVHRDYHSRNLMVLNAQKALGIIDFQDAMIGPITYDLASLLKDCYVRWPQSRIHAWVKMYWEMLREENPETPKDFAIFLRWFDWMGLQRHLKVLGIFSRLRLRDNKPHYLKDIPRIMGYVLEITQQYPEFADFDHFLRHELLEPLQLLWQQQNILYQDDRVA